jgi:hypothetical protein
VGDRRAAGRAEGRDARLLKQLAVACPADQADTASRLLLKSVAMSDAKAGAKPDAAVREKVLKLLADPAAARAHMDVLTNYAGDITKALSAPKTAERAALVEAYNTALKRLEADTTLSRADRVTALAARVELAKIDLPKDAKPVVPSNLQSDAREMAERMDREITDGYERQAVVTNAADMLAQAGLLDESDALLKSNLAKSHSPYYLMLGLASNAKKRGDTNDALHWYEEAYAKSEGPGDAAAVGRELRQRARRPGAAGRGAHRACRAAAVRRCRRPGRCLLRAQRPLDAARGQEAGRLERRAQARRRRAASAGAAGGRLRQAAGRRDGAARRLRGLLKPAGKTTKT